MTFNVVVSKGVLLPTVRQPITKPQLIWQTILFIIKGLISAFISNNTRRITRCNLLWWQDFALFDKLPFKIVFRETFEISRLRTR